jgi:subtilisin family serine protease
MAKNVIVPPHIVNDLNPMMTFSQTIGWGIQKLNIVDLHQKGFTGKGVKIGIIDSGCDLSHPDLKIQSFKNFTESNSAEDTSGHGTHVAGIIAAQGNNYGVLGVAPDAEIHVYKALDGSSGTIKGVIDALKSAIDDGMDIINMSLGTPSEVSGLEKLCKKAQSKGISVVVASGNSGMQENFYPASYDSCLAVGAIDENMKVAYFTTYGQQLDIVAPGAEILSTYLKGSYAILSGTSMAAPFVSGCLALMKQSGIDLNYKNITESTIDIEKPNLDVKSGYGIMNPSKSITGTDIVINKPQTKPKKCLFCHIKSFFKKS